MVKERVVKRGSRIYFNAGTEESPISAHIDLERIAEVCRLSVELLHEKRFPFNSPNFRDFFPESIMPRGMTFGSLDHAHYLFHAVGTDSNVTSKRHYAGFRKAVESRLDLKIAYTYSPEYLKQMIPELAQGDGKKKTRKPAHAIINNSLRLLKQYPSDESPSEYGDPRKIRASTFEGTLERLGEFMEIGPGISRLVAKNFIKFGFWDFPAYKSTPKVDRHAYRILRGTGAVFIPREAGESRLWKIRDALTQSFEIVLNQTKISGVEVNDVLWYIGSEFCVKDLIAECQLMGCPLKCNNRPRLVGQDKKSGYAHLLSPHEETRDTQESLFK